MKKLFKILGWTVLAIIVLALAVVLSIPLWIGPVVKSAANRIVPEKTKTEFALDDFALNPYTGYLRAGKLRLGNPDGFDEKDAFRLGKLEVKVDVGSLLGDTVHVRDIDVSDIFVYSTPTASNFKKIAANAAGEPAEAGVPEVSGTEPEPGAPAGETPEAEPPAEKKPAKKVVIDHIKISGVVVKYGIMSIPVPEIELRDIGKESGGATPFEIGNEIYEAMMEAFQKALNGFGGGLKNAADAVSGIIGESAEKLTEAIGEIDIDAATSAVSDGIGAAAGAVSDGASAVGTAISEGAGSVIEGAGSVVDGVGGKVKDIGGAVKGLFK